MAGGSGSAGTVRILEPAIGMLGSLSSVSGFEESTCDYILMVPSLVYMEQPVGVVKGRAHRGKNRLKLSYFPG